jgi:hypothetical protein
MRAAQQREAEALAGVCAADERLRKAREKRDAAVTAATATVRQAQAVVESAQAGLVRVSGVERAAVLLAVDIGELRKVAGRKSERRDEP